MAIKAEKNEKVRKRLLKSLRGKFNHEFNIKAIEKGKGEIFLERRPASDIFNIEDYGPCPRCLFWIAKKLLKKHEKTCIHQNENAHTSVGDLTTQSECLAKRINPTASKKLINEVFKKMTPDEVSKVAQNDILVIQLGNQWMERVRGNILKRGSYTSQIMRLVARFLLNLRKIKDIPGNGEKSLWEYLKPEHFNLLVDAAIRTAVPLDDNLEDDALKSPSNAIKLGYDVKRVINGKIGLAIMKSDMESQKEAESLFKLMNIYWGSKVTKHARVILEERRFYAEKNLPLPVDIQRLNTHMQQAISHLDFNKKDSENFKTVGKLVEAKLVLYNRRRAGEVQAIRYKHSLFIV